MIIQHVKHESVQAIVNRDYDRAAQLEANIDSYWK